MSLCADYRLMMINELKNKANAEIMDFIQANYLPKFNNLSSIETSLWEMVDDYVVGLDHETEPEQNFLDSLKNLKFMYELDLDNVELNYFYTQDTYSLIIKYFNSLDKYDMDMVRKRYANVKNELGKEHFGVLGILISSDREFWDFHSSH